MVSKRYENLKYTCSFAALVFLFKLLSFLQIKTLSFLMFIYCQYWWSFRSFLCAFLSCLRYILICIGRKGTFDQMLFLALNQGCQGKKGLIDRLPCNSRCFNVIHTLLGAPFVYLLDRNATLQIFLIAQEKVRCVRNSLMGEFIPNIFDILPTLSLREIEY